MIRLGLQFFCLIIFLLPSSAQEHYDQHWILRGTINLDFKDSQLHIESIPSFPEKIFPGEHAITMNSKTGELLFYTGGCEIINFDHLLMINGDSLNPGARELGYCKSGSLPWDQSTIIIPFPGYEEHYFVFTMDVGAPFDLKDTIHFPLVPLHVYSHQIKIRTQLDTTEVILKNASVLSDTLSRGYLQITRHGNGRDWWLIVPEWNSNCYYSLLISPVGIDSVQKTCAGFNYGDSDLGGMSHVSPNGEKYARCSGEDVRGIQVLDFDRCSGTLSDGVILIIPESEMYFTGIGFSPDSRYVYVTTKIHAWQFDLLDDDIQSSLELVGELQPSDIMQGKGTLYHQQIGPNGIIYIASPGSHAYLSTINNPNQKGSACNFQAHNIQFPDLLTNYRALPNNAFFRLGPLDESSCDTLGLNNVPVALFRADPFKSDSSTFEFTNLSYFEPELFHWDFGDGHFSNQRDPIHTYDHPGVYEVCLNVSNTNGSDDYCESLVYLETGIENVLQLSFIHVYPNPTSGIFHVEVPADNSCLNAYVTLYNSLGSSIFMKKVSEISFEIDVTGLTAGVYLIKFTCDQKSIASRRMVVLH